MYAVMLFAAPAMLWLALRRPWLLMALSVALWLATGLLEWNLPNFPNEGGWFFNPLAWQIIFVIGLLTGVAHREGRRFVPILRPLQIVAGLVLFNGLLWNIWPAYGERINTALWQASENGLHRFFAFGDKTYVTWPRLIHILSLAYLLSCFDWVRRAAGSRPAAPLALLGRHALPVFAVGSLLALTAQAFKDVTPPGFLLDTALIVGGIGLQYTVALLKDRLSIKRRPSRLELV